MELYFDRAKNNYVIKDGSSILVISDEEFSNMRSDGRSPVLKKLYDQAKLEKQQTSQAP
jgi:hypothetical protein